MMDKHILSFNQSIGVKAFGVPLTFTFTTFIEDEAVTKEEVDKKTAVEVHVKFNNVSRMVHHVVLFHDTKEVVDKNDIEAFIKEFIYDEQLMENAINNYIECGIKSREINH